MLREPQRFCRTNCFHAMSASTYTRRPRRASSFFGLSVRIAGESRGRSSAGSPARAPFECWDHRINPACSMTVWVGHSCPTPLTFSDLPHTRAAPSFPGFGKGGNHSRGRSSASAPHFFPPPVIPSPTSRSPTLLAKSGRNRMNGRAWLPAVPFDTPFDKPRRRSGNRGRRVHSPLHPRAIPQRILKPLVPSITRSSARTGGARLPAVPSEAPFEKPRRRSDRRGRAATFVAASRKSRNVSLRLKILKGGPASVLTLYLCLTGAVSK
jgi:hypothetical protein